MIENPSLSTTDKILKNPEVIESEVQGETMLLDIEGGHYFGIEPVGTAIWSRISAETPIEIDAIITALLQEFDVNEATCHAETLQFLGELYDKKLIQRAE